MIRPYPLAFPEECEKSVNDLFTFMAINKLAVNDDKTKILAMKYGRAEQDTKLSFQFGIVWWWDAISHSRRHKNSAQVTALASFFFSNHSSF